MAKKQTKADNKITITDDEGVDHAFHLLEVFKLGAKHFALLQSAKGPKDEVTILRLTVDKDGMPEAFEAPTDAEFKKVVQTLKDCECASDCGCECECHEEAPAKRAPAKRPAAKKAARVPARKAAKLPAAAAKRAAKKPAKAVRR